MTMPTNYQIKKIQIGLITIITVFSLIIVLGNVYNYVFTKKITVNENSYKLINGYPVFTSESAYMKFLSNYPYDIGAHYSIHNVNKGETLWSLKRRYGISLHTLLGANPHLKDLKLDSVKQVVIPSTNGAMIFFKNYSSLLNILNKNKKTVNEKILSNYEKNLFKLFSPHDIKLVFVSDIKPVVVNNDISRLYAYMNYFSTPIDNGFFTSMFGERVNPFFESFEFHNGIDIASRMRTNIKAAKGGIVFFSGWKGGFGKTVIIQHRDGYTSLYGHCSKLLVKTGEWIKKDQIIALVGSTGRSTGPHLHYTIFRHGKAINPIDFIW